ncbi:PREDICTED: death domain-containing protein 1-like [Branchiostoma belcheri]|uniref:Death domain-containing protein 1-like n=1 Tax=Branchiostoma belcheri TaxID=7741 RepID=A0A6P5AKL8_BRABE|nr:PREDICTED: death domain-containing protein 1-like [Branchiostoma belcheri]
MSGTADEPEPALQPRQIAAQVSALARQLERENAKIQAAGKAGLARGKVAGLLQELTAVLEDCARESGELAAGIRHVRGVLAGTRDGLKLAGGRDRCAKEHHGQDDPKEASVGNLRKSVDEAMTVAEKAEGTVAEVAREAEAAILEDARELNQLECIEDQPVETTEEKDAAAEETSEEKAAPEATISDSNEVAGNQSENVVVDEPPDTEEKVAEDEKESEEDKTKEVPTNEESAEETEKKENDVKEMEKTDDDTKDNDSAEKTDNKSTEAENDIEQIVEKQSRPKSEDRPAATTKTKESSKKEKKKTNSDRVEINLNTSPEDKEHVDQKTPANPGIWSTFPLDALNDDGQSELACLIKVDIGAVTNFPVTCQIANQLASSALAQNEELVSHVVQLAPAGWKLPVPAVVSLPYTWSRHVSRELAVKATADGETWKTVPLKAADVVYKDRKGHFVEFEVSRLACYVVVSRLKVETFTLQKSKTKPNVFRSSVDQRIELNFPPGAIKTAGALDVQVQPVDSISLSALKSRCPDCDSLISTSPIVSLALSPGLRLHKPVDITVPCPLNPAGNWARDPTRPGTAGLGGSRKLGGVSPRPGSAPAGRTSLMEEGDNGDDLLHLLASRKLGGTSPRPGSAPAGRTSLMEEGDNGDDFLHLLGSGKLGGVSPWPGSAPAGRTSLMEEGDNGDDFLHLLGSRKLGGTSPRPGSAPAGRTSLMEEGDNGDDFLHLLGQPEGEEAWAEVMGVRFRQNKKGLVTFETAELLGKFIVLRTADPAAEQFQGATEAFPRLLETSLGLTDARLILRTKTGDPERAVVRCVPARDVREAELQLDAAGYEEAEPSKEVLLKDGDELVLKFSGNVSRDTDGDSRDSVRLTFYSQRRTQAHFYIKEVNEFGNYSSPCYRGMVRFYGTRRRVGKPGAEDPDRGPPDVIKNAFLGDAVEEGLDSICKLPVTLPKRERDPPRPPSAYRKLIESQGPLVNDWLQWLASEIDEDWDLLGHHLRVKRSRLQHIKRNNPEDLQQQAFDMLYSWRKSLPAAADKIGKLCRALSRVGRRDLAEELRERYSDHRKKNGKA